MRLVRYVGQALSPLVAREDVTFRDAMSLMSKLGLRLLPIVGSDDRFVGVLADGDVRRCIDSGGSLDAPVSLAVNRDATFIDKDMSDLELRKFMDWKGVEYLPQVEDGVLTALHVLWLGAKPSGTTAVIMAGGLGSRLAPLTDHCPKPLLEVAGKPILTHIIEHLRSQGVDRFVLSLGYLSEMIVNHYGDGEALGVSISYVHETKRMGTGGALSLIDPDILSDPFLCLNGDLLNDVDVPALLQQHADNTWDATMVLFEHSLSVPYGVVHSGDDGSFLSSEEKPTLRFSVNAGIYMISKSALNLVPEDIFYDLPTLFGDLTRNGLQGGTYLHQGRWIDIGNIPEFERAQKTLGAS